MYLCVVATLLFGAVVGGRGVEVPDKLIAALMRVESGGRDNAIGDRHLAEKAYGCLQVRKPCIEDVNGRFGKSYRPEDCLGNRALSVWVCKRYIALYATPKRLGRAPNEEEMARIWNGGPNGWKNPKTEKYWHKVRRELERGQKE